jgi:hypothetical protein
MRARAGIRIDGKRKASLVMARHAILYDHRDEDW